MKIVVVGASGTIGRAVVEELGSRHEIVKVGHQSGDVTVDIRSEESIQKMFHAIGNVDAVVSTTGSGHFGPLETLTEKEFAIGIESKLMGQINLVLIGRDFMNDGGSFTMTSGVLTHDPIYCGAAVTTVNAGLEGFVLGASIELPRGIRINAVSPEVVEESMDKIGSFF